MKHDLQTPYNKLKQRGLGPGGFHCPCCTDLRPAKQKKRDSRRLRRIYSMALKKQET